MNKNWIRNPARLGFALFLAGIILSACSKKPDYNVLLITLDTTRADHLRCYGYQNVETPALNSLAREGVAFGRAYAPNPMTLPAHTTILSGTLPLYHGVYDNGGFIVPQDLILLPEVLKENGWTTAGFVSAAVLKKDFNLNQGFEFWDEEGITPQPQMHMLVAERKANAVTDAALRWLEKNGKQKRWFLWVHYFDPHTEYDPPDPYKSLYYFDRYSGEIAFMDSQIQRLLQDLKQKGLYEKTIIIAIADHGESLGEHQEPTHFVFLYEATQRVPFLIRIPGLKKPGAKILKIVSQIDLFPTILDLLNLPIPDQAQGRSLKPLIDGKEANELAGEAFLESHFSYLHFGWSELYGLVTDHYKYIQAPKPELYDLSLDPRELNNIAEKNPKLVKEFDLKVEEIKTKSARPELAEKARAGAKMDTETRRQLLALGYLPGVSLAYKEKAKLDNPKDYADLLSVVIDSMNDLGMSRNQDLLDKAEKILGRDPDNLLGIRLKANGLFALGEYQKDVDWIKHSIAITGESGDYYALLGTCYLRLQQIGEAKSSFEKTLRLEPGDFMSRYYLARIYLKEGRAEEALKLIDEGKMREEPGGHLLMAVYYLSQDRPGRAEAEFEQALSLAPNAPLTKLEYADYLMKKGDAKKALELFMEAENLDPSLKMDANFQKVKERAREMIEKGT